MSSNLLDNNTNMNTNLSKDDKDFLKNIIKDFYRKIIEMKDFNNFEDIFSEWIINYLEINNKDSKKILELMENHKKSKFWFTSIIGIFYQFGIGNYLDKKKALELYLLTINIEIEKNNLNEEFNKLHLIEVNINSFNSLKNKNIIIGKYLLSLFYYKDIILDIEGFNYNHRTENSNQNESIKLLKLAKEGNSDAQYNLAICYMDGLGIQKNEKRAFDWLLKSEQSKYLDILNKHEKEEFERDLKLAIANNPLAQNYIGYCYENGKGVYKNEKKAYEWYLKSADGGNVEGQCNLGYCYENGIGTEKNEIEAFEWYLKSADGGNVEGQCYLGYCYENGIGIDKDETKAFEWYLESAEGGSIEGQCNLGYCYENGIGTDQDEIKAFEWYSESAENGNETAQNNLGDCYQCGKGTDKDEIKAFEWYFESANAECPEGQRNLGFCYANGIGTEKNEIKAFEWYLKSVENGNIMAQNNLGDCYQHGKGIDKNETKAFEWYLKSAIAGCSYAQCNLGYCYANGIGTDKNETKAFEWYLKSAENGDITKQFGHLL
ncbi:unnamed protein product [Rhizophagus irregularis]|nr:unnamed protein product [Rhizophagus irregularis]